MFQQNPDKVERNPLRAILQEKGYTVRSAARALGMSPARFLYRLDAHDEDYDLPARIAELPDQQQAPVQR